MRASIHGPTDYESDALPTEPLGLITLTMKQRHKILIVRAIFYAIQRAIYDINIFSVVFKNLRWNWFLVVMALLVKIGWISKSSALSGFSLWSVCCSEECQCLGLHFSRRFFATERPPSATVARLETTNTYNISVWSCPSNFFSNFCSFFILLNTLMPGVMYSGGFLHLSRGRPGFYSRLESCKYHRLTVTTPIRSLSLTVGRFPLLLGRRNSVQFCWRYGWKQALIVHFALWWRSGNRDWLIVLHSQQFIRCLTTHDSCCHFN